MTLTEADFPTLDSEFRRHFFNTLPGPRGVHLLATRGYKGQENVAVFSSVIHIGARPPLLGFLMRQLTVPRQTYHHIQANKWFTLNTIQPKFLHPAHQTSANYELFESEFTATGLTPEYLGASKAPYVAESPVKIGLTLEEEHLVRANGTRLLIGRIRELFLPDEAVADSGHVDHVLLQTMTVAGLDTYHEVGPAHELPYARPGKKA